MEQKNEPEEEILSSGHSMIVDDLDGIIPTDIDCPANISVHTKAKRYQNSV